MDECLSWSAPSSQRPVRNNSTVAGSPLLHDSAHPDYRRVNEKAFNLTKVVAFWLPFLAVGAVVAVDKIAVHPLQ